MVTHWDSVTVKQLRCFIAVAQSDNLGIAADQVFLTRGAVSQSLQELESRLGRPLFDRVKRRLIINKNGQELLPLALEVMDRMQSVTQVFENQHAPLADLRLGASKTIGSYLLPTLMREWPKEETLPDVVIENTTTLIHMIENHELDIALVEGVVESTHLNKEECHGDEVCVIAAGDQSLPKVTDLQWLSQQSWIVRESGSGSRHSFEEKIAAKLTEPSIRMTLNANEAILNAVSNGLGLSALSTLCTADAEAAGKIQRVPSTLTFERQFTLIWHKQRYLSPSHQRLITLLKA